MVDQRNTCTAKESKKHMFGWFKKPRSPFIGTWILIQAGDQPPEDMGILSMRLIITADGVLSWESRMRGPWDGMTLKGNGRWSASGDRITYTGKDQTSTSIARFEKSRMLLEPDFVLVKDGATPVISVYERLRPNM